MLYFLIVLFGIAINEMVIILGRLKFAGNVARMGRKGLNIGFCFESREGKRPLGRLGRSWEVNIEMHIR
jgi:hypothetical protein